ncbi:MAG: polyprenyl synthetase family protein [Propionibacteriaceae bacterium]|jgi:geranylgeranyl diphosphate synthase type I|nr:polyprenyl synthetase family protein [Propionibacteriaceae bacterium]
MRFNPDQPLGPDFRDAIRGALTSFVETQRDLLAEAGPRLDGVWRHCAQLVAGGKRVRPAFCYWSFVAASGSPNEEDDERALTVAASLDLLHLAALVHDDVIDASDTRRGVPSAHRLFAAEHAAAGRLGDPDQAGLAGAILLGDLLMSWSVAMAGRSGWKPSRMRRAQAYLDAVRSEVVAGQFLDLIHQADPEPGDDFVAASTLVMDFKTSRYTVARPAQIGAALGGADDATIDGLGRFGAHVGRAYQMRDDLLGVFGDAEVTGKPVGGDLREGKRTVLIGYALRDAEPAQAQRLAAMLGDPTLTEADITEAKAIIQGSGAVEATERMIVAEASAGERHLSRLGLTGEGTAALAALVHAAVERTG